MKTIDQDVTAQIVEKKSKFICNLCCVNNIQEAEEKLNAIKKKYYDAKHHCYTYRINQGNQILEKSSDDGEPAGTAGAPMLNLLKSYNLQNCLIVVTRYFRWHFARYRRACKGVFYCIKASNRKC